MELLCGNRQGRFALSAAAVGCCAAWLGATSVAHARSARAPSDVSRTAEEVCYIYDGQYICIPKTPASDTTTIR